MLPTYAARQGSPGDLEFVGNSSGNKAAATAAATLTHDGAKRLFLTGFEITGAGATGASVVLATVTGLVGGTRTYVVAVPAGVSTQITPLAVEFPVPIPAVDVNTDIVVTLPSLGAGNTNACVNASGFKVSPTN